MQRVEHSKSNNVVYYIDDEARTVTAELKCSPYEPQDILDCQIYKHLCGYGNGFIDELDYVVNKYAINSSYIGKAKCHPDDEFNVEFGKRLALLRAKKKHLNAVERKLDKMTTWMNVFRERMHKTHTKYVRMIIDNDIELYQTENDIRIYKTEKVDA